MLDLRDIGKTFATRHGAVRVLAHAHMQVAAGECVAVQGSSGCGKTTLLLIAGGLLRPDAGLLQCDGQSVYALDRTARAIWRGRMIGFVFQQFHLVPYLSVFENISVGSVTLGADLRERARELAAQFGLTARLLHRPDALSIGERQRTALARALAPAPRVVLADEPTGNLDDDNAAIVLRQLRAYADAGNSVVIVTHSAAAAACAHRVLRLRDGMLAPA
jgi:putative ABC transport system ATP-binding protein